MNGTVLFLKVVGKAVQHQGKTRRLDLRKYVIMQYITAQLEDTEAETRLSTPLETGSVVAFLKTDVDNFIRSCLVCRYAKGKTLVTGGMRSSQKDPSEF